MVLKLLPGHTPRGGGVLDPKAGEAREADLDKMEKEEEETADPIIETLGEIGR